MKYLGVVVLMLAGCDDLGSWVLGPDQVQSAGPCDGYRTEALLVVDGTTWAGCGADPGLFRSTSPSAGFSSVPALETMHVFDLQIGPDSRLWIAGDEVSSNELLYSYEPATGELDALLRYDGSDMRLSAGHNIAWTPDGTVYVDSLTGNYLAASSDHGEAWTEHYLQGYQILDLSVADDVIWGSGSTIAQPPTVWSMDEQGTMVATELDVGWTGTLEAVQAMPSGAVILGGLDESVDSAKLLVCQADCDLAASWAEVDLPSLGLIDGGKVWSLHAAGSHVIAVGERYPQSHGGFVLTSDDGGSTWELAGGELPMLTAASIDVSGAWRVAGGDGFLADGN